ncbi:hypothetical protein AAIO99_02600 [Streptomyces sp. AC154]
MPPRTGTTARTGKFRAATIAAVLALGASLLATAPHAGAAEPDPVPDYCQGQCDDILPPGENGNATLVDILGNKAFGTHPAHSDDQLDRYDGLVDVKILGSAMSLVLPSRSRPTLPAPV